MPERVVDIVDLGGVELAFRPVNERKFLLIGVRNLKRRVDVVGCPNRKVWRCGVGAVDGREHLVEKHRVFVDAG